MPNVSPHLDTPLPVGAYGLRLQAPPELAELLVPAPDSWLDWRLELARGDGSAEETIDAARATAPLQPAGWAEVRRQDRLTRFLTPEPLNPAALAHPYLAFTAAVAARWAGRQTLHAGAVRAGDGGWGVIGARGQGKSSTLAYLAGRGLGVVADDVLVIAGGAAMAAPRCLDLRADAAEALGVGTPLGRNAGRERWRVRTAAVPAETPLRGFLVLEWGDRVEREPVSAAERLELIFASLTVHLPPPDPPALLDLAALPMWRVCRPRRLGSLSEIAELIEDLAAG
jgi:hypothetical protein